MKKLLLIFLLIFAINSNMVKATVIKKVGCYEAYLNQWSMIYYFFVGDIRACGGEVITSWASFGIDPQDPVNVVTTMMNMGCGFDALDRYNTQVGLAADALFACNGLVVRP